MATGCDTTISLITLADAAEYLGDTGSTANWGKIADIANAIAARMNAECGRNLKATTHTEYYDGNGTNELILRHFPLTSSTMVIYDDPTRAFTSTAYLVASTDIMLSSDAGIIRLDNDTFTAGTNNIKVAYSAGFSSSGPAWDLIAAAREYLQLAWNRVTKRDQIGLRTESFEGGSRTFEGDLPWSVRKVLELYKDRRAG